MSPKVKLAKEIIVIVDEMDVCSASPSPIVAVRYLRLVRSAHKAPRDDQLMRRHAYSLHMAAETHTHILHLIKIHTVGAQGASEFII